MKQVYTENGYTFTVDENKTTTAEGKVPVQGVKCGSRVTPEGMQPGDQRGHIIAAQEGGPNKSFNMTAQNGKLNQGAYKKVENAEVDLARQGYDVHTSKTAYVSNQQGARPDAYMINDTITAPDGKTQSVHLSFQNMSPEMQEAINEEVNSMDISDEYANPDPLRDSMSKEEYNSLMEETEAYMPSIKDEFDMNNTTEMTFDNECVNEATANYEGEGVSTDNAGVESDNGQSVDTDGGIDDGCGEDSGEGCSADV